jgi:peptide/nickel transport system ATP-binding protein
VEARPGHKVACHWVEEIADGRIRPHEVTAELVRPDDEAVPVPAVQADQVP